jgi:hypothetical protein
MGVDQIRLAQYENLRKHFRGLVHEVLGEGYYNMGMDVYECDRITCEDIAAKSHKCTFLDVLRGWLR